MNNLLIVFLFILTAHWVGDFVCQTDWMARNKSVNNKALLYHVYVYTYILTFSVLCIFPSNAFNVFEFGLVNGILHFATDYCTSRIGSKLYKTGNLHNFFVVVGFDQLIHQVTLALTLWFMVL